MSLTKAGPARVVGYGYYSFEGMLEAHASGGANTPSLGRGEGISAVHAGANGKYTVTVATDQRSDLVAAFAQLSADTDTAVDGWTVQFDEGTWSTSAGTIQFTVFDGTTASDLPANTHVFLRITVTNSSMS